MTKATVAFASITTLAGRRRINVPVSTRAHTTAALHPSSLPPLQLQLQPSPVEPLQGVFDDTAKTRVFVKRDDKLDLLGAGIYGNKARKLWGLALSTTFPSSFVSWGGPQSNALLALAGLVCGVHKKRFVYYTKSIPQWLKASPQGNYKRALDLGVEFQELSPVEYRAIFGTEREGDGEGGGGEAGNGDTAAATVISLKDLPVSQEEGFRAEKGDDVLLVPQGAAFQGAEEGLRLLAQEIEAWWTLERKKRENTGNIEGGSLAVVLPAGTGTTAYYLAKHLGRLSSVGVGGGGGEEVVVYAVPCVGDGDYLKAQMTRLLMSDIGSMSRPPLEGGSESEEEDGAGGGEGGGGGSLDVCSPEILQGSMPHVFGRPEQALLDVWQEMKDRHGLELDLVYGPHAWRVMREQWGRLAGRHGSVLYLHTGGLEGVPSQLGRYRHLGMLK